MIPLDTKTVKWVVYVSVRKKDWTVEFLTSAENPIGKEDARFEIGCGRDTRLKVGSFLGAEAVIKLLEHLTKHRFVRCSIGASSDYPFYYVRLDYLKRFKFKQKTNPMS